MKYYFLAALVILLCAGTLTWLIRDRVIPAYLRHANEEMVADWHAGLTECRKETGSWPDPADPIRFGEQVYVIIGADGRRIEGGYMHGRRSFYNGGQLFDVFGQPMRVTVNGEELLIASAGPDRTWGTGDDVTSDQVKERHRPSTLALARAEAEERAAKRNR